jgi:hypothetical protein
VRKIAAPPIIAVGFLCHRSPRGFATTPKRRASRRTSGVRVAASANDTATVKICRALKGIVRSGQGFARTRKTYAKRPEKSSGELPLATAPPMRAYL